jgi:hypothetical protein
VLGDAGGYCAIAELLSHSATPRSYARVEAAGGSRASPSHDVQDLVGSTDSPSRRTRGPARGYLAHQVLPRPWAASAGM